LIEVTMRRRQRRSSVAAAAAAAATGEHDGTQEFSYGSHNLLLDVTVKVIAFLGKARYRVAQWHRRRRIVVSNRR
jgi:hypothetical protein